MWRDQCWAVCLGLMCFVSLFMAAHAEDAPASAHNVYAFETSAQETAFNELILELRCPKCQNQNLMDSDSEISQDMKRRIHGMLLAGQSQEDITDTLRARYGDFITYQPPFNAQTAFLWLFPCLLLVFLLIVLIRKLTRQQDKHVDSVTSNPQPHDEKFSQWLAQQTQDNDHE